MRSLIRALPLLVSLAAAGAEVPVPPAPARWATDTAGFLSNGARASLDARLESFERATGAQVLVWIGDSTGDTPVEDWTVKAFAAWKVGRKGLDNGLVLFLFARDRKVRIEVGYGLEEKIPDAIASRIVREDIVPRIQAGDRDGAVTAGVDAILGTLSPGAAGVGEARGAPVRPGSSRAAPGLSPLQIGLAILLGLGFLVLLVTNPGLALYLLATILSGGRGGGGSMGGGGFSGGGGRSGGGGATGSW